MPTDLHLLNLKTPGYIQGSIGSACNSDVKKDDEGSGSRSYNNSVSPNPGSPRCNLEVLAMGKMFQK